MRLLLVDDDRDLCFMLRDYFHDAGISVEFETDGLKSVVRTQSEGVRPHDSRRDAIGTGWL